FGADFVFSALGQNVTLKRLIDASNFHGRRSISTRIKVEREARIHPRRPAYIQHLHGACLRWSGVGSAISLSVAAQPRICARFGRKQAVSAPARPARTPAPSVFFDAPRSVRRLVAEEEPH